MALRQRVSADVEAHEKVGMEFLNRGFQSLHHTVDTAVDIDEQNFFAMGRCHLRLGKEDSCVGLAFWVRHPDIGVENPHIFHFAQHARSWNRIKDRTLPREAAENEFQAAELQEPRRRKRADNIAATADSDHQCAR